MHELPLQRGSIYHQRMIHKNLKRRIDFGTQDFQAKEMILAILLGNKAPNQVSVSCLKVG
jgi:hypothetical protein